MRFGGIYRRLGLICRPNKRPTEEAAEVDRDFQARFLRGSGAVVPGGPDPPGGATPDTKNCQDPPLAMLAPIVW